MRLRQWMGVAICCAATCCAAAVGQETSGGPNGEAGYVAQGPPPGGPCGPNSAQARWWENPDVVQRLGLSAQQMDKITAVLQENRQKLFDLSQEVQRQDFAMQGLMDQSQPDKDQAMQQADRINSARGQLEKARMGMLFDLRQVLTVEQWKKLQMMRPAQGAK